MPKPDIAMVFAAGMGKRMLPLTEKLPKPMISVGGKTMLARALDKLAQSGINHAVVNTHHKAEVVEQYITKRLSSKASPSITLSHEETLLETGGGIVHAKNLLGNSPIYTINSDIIWEDGSIAALDRLAQLWNPDKMDALLLLQPIERAVGYEGSGNFDLLPDGKLCRKPQEQMPFVYTGIQIINPTLFYSMPEEPFSLNILYKNAQQPDGSLHRIYGLIHDGNWFHVGTPDSIAEVEALLGKS